MYNKSKGKVRERSALAYDINCLSGSLANNL